jgi:hypothetical protein
VLELFKRCEARKKRDWYYSPEALQLAKWLGLTGQYWTANTVLDRRAKTHASPEYQAFTDFQTCHAVREQLLAAVAEEDRQAAESVKPTDLAAGTSGP